MPELPEVETIRRGLTKTIVGKRIVDFDERDVKVVQIFKENIIGARVVDIRRRAKIIIFDLDNNKSLIFHMKMTGQLIWESCEGGEDFCLRNRRGGGHPDKAWLEKLPNKHTRAIFYFDDKSVLYFNDIRRFGWVKIVSRLNIKDLRYGGIFDKLGVEPLGKDLTAEYLTMMAERYPNRKVKQFIMDQTIIAGVGNIYADESLFDAKIMPMRVVKDIKKSEWSALISSIKKALEQGIKYGGSSAENFVDAFGQQGKAHEYLKIYRKTLEPCPGKCGGVVERTVIGGRGTHWCKICQR